MNIVARLLALILVLGAAPSLFAQGTLRSGDTVEIRLSGVPSEEIQQFSAPYTIDENGMINLPYIGPMKAAGLTANETQLSVEKRLRDEKIYTHPTVSINVPNSTRFVSVGGSVRNPGRVVYTGDLTLMSAINAAGGFNDFADKKRVRFVREGKAIVVDTRKLMKDPTQDMKVQPGDQIEVPQSLW